LIAFTAISLVFAIFIYRLASKIGLLFTALIIAIKVDPEAVLHCLSTGKFIFTSIISNDGRIIALFCIIKSAFASLVKLYFFRSTRLIFRCFFAISF
jgi:hypothetical protein